LVFNTLFYGTLFYDVKTRLFSIEDIFFYKGRNISQLSWIDKFVIITKMLKNDIFTNNNNNDNNKTNPFLHFGLPIITKSFDELAEHAKKVNYRIDSVQFRLSNKQNYYLIMSFYKASQNINNNNSNNIYNNSNNIYNNSNNVNNKQNTTTLPSHRKCTNSKFEKCIKHETIFKVKPDIQNDIYYLYSLNEMKQEVLVDTALIPNYTTSVMMNRIFRNIKENEDLDLLEESDDEEEFEDENKDKFVYLERSYNMICSMNNRFKKWVPLRIAE
jgi:hypothetical protein